VVGRLDPATVGHPRLRDSHAARLGKNKMFAHFGGNDRTIHETWTPLSQLGPNWERGPFAARPEPISRDRWREAAAIFAEEATKRGGEPAPRKRPPFDARQSVVLRCVNDDTLPQK